MSSLSSINPFNGDVVGQVPVTTAAAVEAIVEKSQVAQKVWAEVTLEERAEALKMVGKELLKQTAEFSELMAKEMGKPVKVATGEVKAVAGQFLQEPDHVKRALQPEKVDHEKFTEVRYFDPLGVSVAITPWNFPLLMPVWQILPALMAGNSVVFKPSEETPLIGQKLAELMQKHLPQNVLQVVHGRGDLGAALVKADVQLITFTGSQRTGLAIQQNAGLKRLILELGGKDPLVVLPGANLEAAAKFAATNGFRNSGQVCVSTERVYVDQSIEKDFLDHLLSETKKIRQGDTLSEDTDLGPMVNSRQKEIVTQQIEQAKESGARVLTGGAGQENFVEPTVLSGVDHSMPVMTEETFGPVLGVMTFQEEEEAVRLANDSPYGLGAVVFGPDKEAERVGRRLQSGMIGINKGVSGVPDSPWVGAKASGYGFHSSEHGHRQFCQVRVLSEAKP